MKRFFSLNESRDKEVAEIIRGELKKLKLSPSDVSVRTERGELEYVVYVSVKTMKAFLLKKNIEAISDSLKNIDRDERSGEILSGGNTFVFVDVDYKFSELLLSKLEKSIEDSNFPEDEDVLLFNGIVNLVVNKRQELFVRFKSEEGKSTTLRSPRNKDSLSDFTNWRTKELDKEQLYSTIASMIAKEIPNNTDIINYL